LLRSSQKNGYDLILVARRKERLQELAEEWTKKMDENVLF